MREAVQAANKTSADDVIVLRGGATYRLTRSPSDLEYTDSLVVKTAGRGRATIDAKRNGSIFTEPIGGAEPQLAVKELVLTGASTSALAGDVMGVSRSRLVRNRADGGSGAAINGGIVSVKRSKVLNNRATKAGGGIYVDRGISLVRSKVAGNEAEHGGGLTLSVPDEDNTSTMTIRQSTISGNEASGFGGGLYNLTEGVTVDRSTFARNHAGNGGGGIANRSIDFGEQFFFGASIELVNSTVAANTANGYGGGIDSFDDDPNDNVDLPYTTLESVTVANNIANADGVGAEAGGGLQEGQATYSTHNTIVARNTVGAGGANPDCSGDIGSDGSNLIGDPTGCVVSQTDLLGAAKLGTLGNHGGPTPTIDLRKGSPAINAGDDAACPDTDQRGVERQLCDIGAFERR